MGAVDVSRVQDAASLEGVRALIAEYAQSLAYTTECASLEHQGIVDEIASLPGKYAEPDGALWLAREGRAPAGCVAVRPMGNGVCELKRLYVRQAWRGRGVGRALTLAAIDWARGRGYRVMRLDTGVTMVAAAALYESLGFVGIPAYNADPVPGTRWMELVLTVRT